MSKKGRSGNTNGGTEISFTRTPQARDDVFGSAEKLDYVDSVYLLDVLDNDLGGRAKQLWSVDDGINDSGDMSGHRAGDLLTEDAAGITGLAENVSQFGAALSVTGDGQVAYDASTITGQEAADLTALALGETADDSFIYAIRLANGTLSWAEATVTLTGVNDAPEVNAVSVTAMEDGTAVTGQFDGDDVDSNDDGDSLSYAIIGSPDAGTLTNNNDGSFSFDPGSDFQSLAAGEQVSYDLGYEATDQHGAVSDTGDLTVTVTGVNDAPVITGGNGASTVTMKPVQSPFTLEQWTGFTSTSLSDLQNHAASNPADYSITTDVIDFTDDPAGFAGEIAGSSPWPAAVDSGATGTGGINDNFFARVTTDLLITESDTYTFRTFNDDGVFLNVDGQSIISDATTHPEAAFEGDIALDPGVYPLELYFFEVGGEASLELSFKNSSGIYQLVGNEPLQNSGTLQFDDVDLNDSHTVSVTPAAGAIGTLSASLDADTTGSGTGGQVSWQYELDGTGQQQLQSLGAGDTAIQQFDVTIDDGQGGQVSRTVDITVAGANDAPTANADAATVDEDNAVTIDVLDNDTDPDNGDTLTIASAADGQNGTVTIANDELVYTPEADFHGTDSFSYTVTDAEGMQSTAAVEVTVNPVNDAPTITHSGLSIANPSFEQNMDDWAILGEGIDHLSGSTWEPGEGSHSIDLNAFDTGGVQQTLATTPGETYTLGFMLSRNERATADRTVEVSAGSSSESFTFTEDTTPTDMKWTWETFTFTANNATTDLAFASQNGGANGPALDGIVPLAARVDEATSITGFSVSDPDAGSDDVLIDLSVDHGDLALGDLTGLTAVDGDGSDGSLSYSGTLSDIGAALDSGVVYTGDTNYSGVDTLTAVIDDQGATGSTALSDSASVDIQVVGLAPDYVA